MATYVTDVLDLGNDVIEVHGTIDGIVHDVGQKVREQKLDPKTGEPVVDEDTGEPVMVTRWREKWELKPLTARGWLSAMTNHFDTDIVEEAQVRHDDWGEPVVLAVPGQRPHDAEAREMTDEEKLAYCKRLLEEQNPHPVTLPEPVSLGIAG